MAAKSTKSRRRMSAYPSLSCHPLFTRSCTDAFEEESVDTQNRTEYFLIKPRLIHNPIHWMNDDVLTVSRGYTEPIIPAGFPRLAPPYDNMEIKVFARYETPEYTATNPDASFYSMSEIPLGTGESARIGRQVRVHAITFTSSYFRKDYSFLPDATAPGGWTSVWPLDATNAWSWFDSSVAIICDRNSNGVQVDLSVFGPLSLDPSWRLITLDSSQGPPVSDNTEVTRYDIVVQPPEPILMTYSSDSTVPVQNNIFYLLSPQMLKAFLPSEANFSVTYRHQILTRIFYTDA